MGIEGGCVRQLNEFTGNFSEDDYPVLHGCDGAAQSRQILKWQRIAMAPTFSSPLLCGLMGCRVSGGRKSPFPFLRFGVLRSLFDVWPSTPERLI